MCLGYDLDETGPLKIQCKRTKKYVSINTIEEVKVEPGDMPVLITKADRKPEVVCMYLDDFLEFVK